MTHEGIWQAIDMLAHKNKMSCSKLAVRSGLDATTFNKSKRFSTFGQPRWPSMQSISKILAATSTTPAEFGNFLEQCEKQKQK